MARFFIMDVYNITGIGPIPVGRVEDGTLRIGMKATLDEKIFTIKSMEMKHKQILNAVKGDNVGISLTMSGSSSSNQVKNSPGFFHRLFFKVTANNSDYNLLKKYSRKSVDFI